MKVLILRPQPGADESAARARALGLDVVVAPLFEIQPLAWTPPDPADFDAVLLTSAHAARCAGGGMTPFLELPCYAVGERTAAAATDAGFADVRPGPSDGGALIALAAEDGVRKALHPCGKQHIALSHPDVAVTAVAVYWAAPVETVSAELDGLALLHSPRAARRYAALAGPRRSEIRIAAISAQAAAAAGPGWASVDIAQAPRDEALLALAAKLCQRSG